MDNKIEILRESVDVLYNIFADKDKKPYDQWVFNVSNGFLDKLDYAIELISDIKVIVSGDFHDGKDDKQ